MGPAPTTAMPIAATAAVIAARCGPRRWPTCSATQCRATSAHRVPRPVRSAAGPPARAARTVGAVLPGREGLCFSRAPGSSAADVLGGWATPPRLARRPHSLRTLGAPTHARPLAGHDVACSRESRTAHPHRWSSLSRPFEANPRARAPVGALPHPTRRSSLSRPRLPQGTPARARARSAPCAPHRWSSLSRPPQPGRTRVLVPGRRLRTPPLVGLSDLGPRAPPRARRVGLRTPPAGQTCDPVPGREGLWCRWCWAGS